MNPHELGSLETTVIDVSEWQLGRHATAVLYTTIRPLSGYTIVDRLSNFA